MEEFIELLQKYISHQIALEDLFTEYSTLRNRVLDDYDAHPLRNKEMAIQREFFQGRMSKEEFHKQSEAIHQQVQTHFRKRGGLVPFTREYEILTDDLVFLIDRLDGDVATFGDDVLTEETFYYAVKLLLEELQQLQ